MSLFKLSPNGARVYGTDTSYVAEISERVLAWKKIPSIVKSAQLIRYLATKLLLANSPPSLGERRYVALRVI